MAINMLLQYDMRIHRLIFASLLPTAIAAAADYCNPVNLVGPYAFQLSGSTKISGEEKPTASLGRIVFDGRGGLSGTASATFSGFLLGNPITGTYEAKQDCSVTWKLQDTSGAFQNFAGTLSADGARIQFRQSDPGGAQRGIMQKTSDTCSAATLLKKYEYTVSGSTTSMRAGDVAHSVTGKGTLDVAENGSFRVESDCSVRFSLTLPAPDGTLTMRGFLVNGGLEILAFQTDPGAMVSARFSPSSK